MWNCHYCKQVATSNGSGESADGQRTLYFYSCKPCGVAWVSTLRTAPDFSQSKPVEENGNGDRRQWAMEYFKLPPVPTLSCDDCDSRRFWRSMDAKPSHPWRCMTCHRPDGEQYRVIEI